MTRRKGHSALRVKEGKIEKFDPHPKPAPESARPGRVTDPIGEMSAFEEMYVRKFPNAMTPSEAWFDNENRYHYGHVYDTWEMFQAGAAWQAAFGEKAAHPTNTQEGATGQYDSRCKACGGAINPCGHSKWNVISRKLNDGSGRSVAECYECRRPKAESNSITLPVGDTALRVAREIRKYFDENFDSTIPGETFDAGLAALIRQAIAEETRTLANRHVQFMVEGGPVVMATDFDKMKERAEKAEKEIAELREALNRLVGVAADLEAFAKASRNAWIPVRERQPDKQGSYLVVISGLTDAGDEYEGVVYAEWGVHRWSGLHGWGSNEVTHWQPLPDPPEAEGK